MRLPITLGLLAGLTMGAATDQAVDEYKLKAAFLFNFAKFIDWPQQSFSTPNDPISICVMGGNPFGKSLEEAVSGKNVNGRTFTVRQISDSNQFNSCQIVFVTSAQRKHASDSSICGVLLVGESDGFAASGGVIGFKLEAGKVKLEINTSAAEQRNLRISSKLLSLATIVKAPGK